jgi:hypothetical protein
MIFLNFDLTKLALNPNLLKAIQSSNSTGFFLVIRESRIRSVSLLFVVRRP